HSAGVETDAGTHILLVTDRREGSSVTLDDVASELEDRIQQREAAAALLADVERLRDIAFNAADLSDPASALKLEVQQSDPVTRNQRQGLFSRAALLQAAFSEDVLEAGHNSEVIELSPEQFVLLRVAERRPSSLQALADVRPGIEAELRERLAKEAATAEADALMLALESGVSVEEAANAAGLQWQVELGARRDSRSLPPVVREQLFAMAAPTAGQSVRKIVSQGTEAIYLMELARVSSGDPESLPAHEREAALRRFYRGVD
ncbi:MAG: peptidyl-prolyl cis-trans isomerase, partial [Congregibacter sp.]|nr:peptidyl-prolyl cis-trans isomerase [Congregibacter sp.]